MILAYEGKTEYVIAIPDKAIAEEKIASTELQEYIFKVSGIKLDIVEEKGSGDKAIFIGNTRFSQSNGVKTDVPEKWIIKTIGNSLVLTGGRPRGCLYAVYHFLEDIIGIRWWNPWEEFVPENSVINIDTLDMSGMPAFMYRDLYHACVDNTLFFVRNRVNGGSALIPPGFGGSITYGPPGGVHTLRSYVHSDEYFDKHPEYFAYTKEYWFSIGKRIKNGQLCMTNKDVVDIIIKKLKEYIRTSYEKADKEGKIRPYMYSITQNDCGRTRSCKCRDCMRFIRNEGQSGLNMMLVNKVAEAIEKEYPEAKIETLAYWYYNQPPVRIKPHSNVVIMYANNHNDILHSIMHQNNKKGLEALKGWLEISDTVFIWDYAVNYEPNPPLPTMYRVMNDYKLFHEWGVKGIFVEHERPITSDMWDMKAWLEIKLMENPDIDINKAIADFTDRYYGKAGSYIRRYLERCREDANKAGMHVTFETEFKEYKYFTPEFIVWADRLFDEATLFASNDEILVRRLNHARSSLDRLVVLGCKDLLKQTEQKGINDREIKMIKEKSEVRLVNTLKTEKEFRTGCQDDGFVIKNKEYQHIIPQ